MFLYIPDSCKKPTMTLNSSDSHSQFLLEKIIKMSESAVMSAEESMRSAMLAKEHAISALNSSQADDGPPTWSRTERERS